MVAEDIEEDVSQPSSRRRRTMDNDSEAEEEDNYDDDCMEVQFTQQAPELSQPLLPVKPAERRNLDQLSRDARNKAVTDLSRLLLFKSLAGESIDRLKCAKEALGDMTNEKITSAVFEDAAKNLSDVFGFELKRVPEYMERRKNFPAKFKDRMFVVNELEDTGAHSKAIHGIHDSSSIEKGLLMVILAFCFCKGEVKNDSSRWISDKDLYRLLNGVDENIPAEPPTSNKKKSSSASTSRMSLSGKGGVSQTPDVDSLLHKFVEMDYLLKDKEKEDNTAASQSEERGFIYSMGPRAAMEIGRKQLLSFCAEVMDEAPDPTMLAEIEEDGIADDGGEYVSAD